MPVMVSATRTQVSGAGHDVGEPALVKNQDMVGAGGDGRVMGDHHHGLPQLVHRAAQQADDRLGGVRVERRSGLIGKDHLRAGDPRPGDGHPLLPARERRQGS